MAEGSVVELLFATRVPFGFSIKISISTLGTGHWTDHVKLWVAAKLEALMQEADKKIAELKQLETTHHEPEIKPFEPKSAPLPTDARYSAIYDLADAGHSVQEIAQQLDRPRGEVELILALRVPSESQS